MDYLEASNKLKDIAFKQRATRQSYHGRGFMKYLQPILSESIKNCRVAYEGKKKIAFITMTEGLEAEVMAFITITVCLDNSLDPPSATTLANRIGEYINQEINFRRYNETEEGAEIMTRIRNKYRNHRAKRSIHKAAVNGDMGDVQVDEWLPSTRRSIGWVLLRMLEEIGYLTKYTVKRTQRYKWSDEVQSWFIDTFNEYLYYTPNRVPLLSPPDTWVEGQHNHSYGVGIPPVPFRLHSFSSDSAGSSGVNLPAANDLGAVAYRLNEDVLDVVLQLWRQSYSVGDLVPSTPVEFIPYPEDGSEEDIKAWSKHATKVYTTNQHTYGRRLYYMRTWGVVESYRGKPFYFLWRADSRGRLYPTTSILLSPQGNDLGKSLLQFSTKKRLGSRGLYHLHLLCAEKAGVDKVSLDDRYKWTVDNLDLIQEVGTQHTRELWKDMDSPFGFLAACIELTKALRCSNPEDYESGIIRHLDGKCSGAQHWAALLRDSDVGKSVGLSESYPSDRPPDLYSEVLNTWVKGLIDRRWTHPEYTEWGAELATSGHLTRSWVKPIVMTYIYGSKIISWSRGITSNLRGIDEYKEVEDIAKRGHWLATCIRDVLVDRLTSVVEGMKWISESVRHIDSDTVNWYSSSGFQVNLRHRKTESNKEKVYCAVFNTPITYNVAYSTTEVDYNKQATTIAPNFIHSQDAAHLSLSVRRCAASGLEMSAIHDSFGTHLCDVDEMGSHIKHEFITMYIQDKIRTLRNNWVLRYGDVLPKLPEYGDLEIADTIHSTYAFS